MRGGRILWGQIAVVFTIVLVMTWAATQWTAFRLGFQPQLGNPWFELIGWPVYYPPAFFWWWFSFDAYAPAIFVEGGIIAVSGGFLAIAAAILMSIIRAREARNVATYGSARWAEDKEIRSAGLLGLDGVVLGRHERDYLRHDGPEHVLCFAPTRSGKGVGLVVPTLLTWPGSCIVHDIKGENWTLTAGFRSKHGRVLLFDPTNARSAAYNPLLEVRQGAWEVRDVQNIADILRRSRGLGQRGRLTAENEDLLWLPRSAIVTSISALDAYVHAVLYERIPTVISTGTLPDSLAKALSSIIPIKDANTFRDALPIITSPAPHGELATRLRTKTLEFLSYQAPEKIQGAYEMIGHDSVFASVSALWPGPNSTEDDLKRILANYVKRRNQIAHEGDREADGTVRHIQPQYADKVASFVQNLVNRLNRVVYPNEAIEEA